MQQMPTVAIMTGIYIAVRDMDSSMTLQGLARREVTHGAQVCMKMLCIQTPLVHCMRPPPPPPVAAHEHAARSCPNQRDASEWPTAVSAGISMHATSVLMHACMQQAMPAITATAMTAIARHQTNQLTA